MKDKYFEEVIFVTEAYSKTCQTSKMKRFVKIVNDHNQGSEYYF